MAEMKTLNDLIARLAFYDHEEGTDITSQLNDLVVLARTEGWSVEELTLELNEFYRDVGAVVECQEQLDVLNEVLKEIPSYVAT